MQAIILCGGLGTRLRSVIGEKQKTMVEKEGHPFLYFVVNYLKKYGIKDIIFAMGYKKDEIENYFGDGSKFDINASFAVEKKPLGTGGAIRNTLHFIKDEYVVVLNGDTLFPVNIDDLKEKYIKNNLELSIACKNVDDKKRYGTIMFSEDKKYIVSFMEKIDDNEKSKSIDKKTYINGGVYIISKRLISSIKKDEVLSLEKELIPSWLENKKKIGGIISDEKFIDIGTPESLLEFKNNYKV